MMSHAKVSYATLLIATMLIPIFVFSDTASDLEKQISDHNREIETLNAEIAQYEKQLTNASSKKRTLQNELDQLNISRKKITASINITKKRISTAELEIAQLSRGIAGKERSIQTDKAGLAETLRLLDRDESETLVTRLLSSVDLSAVWSDIDAYSQMRGVVASDIRELTNAKKSLTQTKTTAEGKRAELLKQQKILVGQQGSLDATRKAQNELLVQTKSQEANFQTILAQKQAAKAVFESALQDLQSKLQYTVDPSKITPAGRGILSWPVDKVRVTQEFGSTAFSRSGAYNGKGHNGIDIAAQIGTPIKSALTGTVIATGDTGLVKGCYSYGRWVLIKHGNGLDTLYAHLSQINAYEGQSVATGQLIGYSGQTGYATGPHLHFSVYVSSVTQVMRLGEATNKKTACSNAVMPIAPLSGYLNPENYL